MSEPTRFGKEEPQPQPGAGSQEPPVQDRVIPGTASAEEGYSTEGGTRHGEALAGLEADADAETDEE
jgi:hypothetical protein